MINLCPHCWVAHIVDLVKLLPPFQIVRLSSIARIHLEVNESRHIYMPRFINIYTNVDNARKSYIVKRRKYIISLAKSF